MWIHRIKTFSLKTLPRYSDFGFTVVSTQRRTIKSPHLDKVTKKGQKDIRNRVPEKELGETEERDNSVVEETDTMKVKGECFWEH